jgi:arginyl-tRNA synthetase
MIKDIVKKIIIDESGVDSVPLMTPKHPQFGDVSVNVRQIQATKPDITVDDLAERLRKNTFFEHVDIVGNFINVFINKSELLKHSTYEPIKITDPRRIVIEFAHPNTHKMFHVGHLRNITLGESLCRILAFQGAEIIRVNYQGDVGLHIAKCLYILKKANTDINSEEVKNMPLNDKIAFLGKAYADGNTAYEADEAAKSGQG